MPSTYFTAGPHWRWLIVLYFFVGGIAGGTYFLAALIDCAGRPGDRPLARLGYYVAFPAVIVCGILLVLDLNRPDRFWHMLVQSATWKPMFKAYSPMSVGAWALLGFGFFSLLSFLAALAEERSGRWQRFGVLRPPGPLGLVAVALGGLFGLFLSGYTGVLLAVTNRPVWADTPLLGLVFVVSAASTSAAVLMLLGSGRRWPRADLAALQRFDAWALILELVVLAALVASLGSVARLWLNGWGVLLGLGVVVLGILVPLLLHWRVRLGGLTPTMAAVLVLLGGFLLRVVIVMSTEVV
ncbi:MAG: polysulfide reductase NrfD [Candidatus Rokubacteria bacterium]|nr:polysulfide reductase NrfD [Candidatus Rokubacteria bacterium]MBI3107237.1 polysulfide reductase NrfD [Candidatus Rokubacteria bacterium]